MKAQAIKITVQDDVIEGQPIVVSCDAVVAASGNVSLLYSNAATDHQFLDVNPQEFASVPSVLQVDDCQSSLNVQYIGGSTFAMNGTRFKCHVSAPESESEEVGIFVIPGSSFHISILTLRLLINQLI